MHSDELLIDAALVRRLVGDQFPEWVDLPLLQVESSGTINAVFRLGDDLAVRLARRKGATRPGDKEFEWLRRLAPLLPVDVPVPVAQGRPSSDYPWFWQIHRWVDGEVVPVEGDRRARGCTGPGSTGWGAPTGEPRRRPARARHLPSRT
jgi:aminoglycoside phosphotransferase (APT) family kinase protein